MKIFDVLFHLFLFLKITSGLKCHECSDLSGGKSCSSLRRFSNKDCDLPISKNERAICKSSWKNDSLYNSECSVASVDEETGCCFKGGPVNNRTICTCDKDFCLDKPEPNIIINRCKKDVEVERDSGLKCYECNNVVGHSCTSLNKATKRDCSQPSSGERSVCKSSWKDGEIYNSECSVAPFKEATGCCLKNGNRISCTCDTDLCIENPGPNSLKLEQCGNDDSRNRGLLCYNCKGKNCIYLTTANTSYCIDPVDPNNNLNQYYKAVCKTVFLRGIDRPSEIQCSFEPIDKEAGCCIVDRRKTECTCDTDLCVNDIEPPATALCGTGLKCYDCLLDECKSDVLLSTPVTNCRDRVDQKALCVSIWNDGVWTKSHCDFKKPNEKLGCCVEEVRGVTQTRCTCDKSLCTNDGSAVTDICESSTGLKCYHCNSALQKCDKLTAQEASFCGPPDTASDKKSVCQTIWNEGILKKTSCASVDIREKTECCDKSRFSDEYSCTCTSALCLGDGNGKPTEQCDPTPRLKCYDCYFGRCKDLASLTKADCQTPKDPSEERVVCQTEFSPEGNRNEIRCGTTKLIGPVEPLDCCNDFGYNIICKCTKDLCVGDGKGGDGKSTQCPFDGLKCYGCSSREACKALTSKDNRLCSTTIGLPPRCTTTWNKDGELTSSRCDYRQEHDDVDYSNCCFENKRTKTKECFCENENFCLGDGTGKPLQRCDPVDPQAQNLKLKCYVCNNIRECYRLEKASVVTCNDGTSLTGNDELKHICESKYRNDLLLSVQCKTVDMKAITDCCAKDFCSCSEDKCLGDGKEGTQGPDRPCQCGVCGPKDVECYICGGVGQPSCGDGNVDPTTPRKVCVPGQVCYSERDLLNDKIKRACYTRIKNENVGSCKSFGNLFSCLCNKDLCLGDGFRDDVIATTPPPGITCYQCDGDCEDLNKINKEVCLHNDVCLTVAKDGIITRRGCYPYPYYQIGRCIRTDTEPDHSFHSGPFDGDIACFCDKELCIGDGNGDSGKKPKINYGVKCYTCGTRHQQYKRDVCPSEPNFDYSEIKTRLCEPYEVCASEISADGFRIRHCYQLYEIENLETTGECTPFEGEIGENVGARCLCNNEDFCLGDGNGNDAQVTKKINGGGGTGTGGGGSEIPDRGVLRCYECYNCDEVDGKIPMVPCPVGHCIKSTNDGIVSRYCGIHGTVGKCEDGICACNDRDGCNGSRGLTASASCSVGVAIFISYLNN